MGFRRLSEQEGFRNSFLASDEGNIDQLLSRMGRLFQTSLAPGCSAGRRRGRAFRYDEEAEGFTCPIHGLDPEGLAMEVGRCFDGTLRWHHPNAAFNITPTPVFDAVAAAAVAMVLNPNCLWDETSGRLLLAEQKVVRAVGAVLFPGERAGGFSTFGGKATLMYGIKMGMANSDRGHKRGGLRSGHAVLASTAAHYSLEDVADYLGIGSSAVVRVSCDASGCMDLGHLGAQLDQCLADGRRIATVIVNAGVTIDFNIDDASAIRRVCALKEEEHRLDYGSVAVSCG